MATVIEKPEPTPKFAARVDEQIAEATSRIRGHDLALGGLLVGGLVLGYAVGMIVLDKYLILPEWLRQLSLLAFLGAAGATAYRTLVLPLRLRINPLYAAVAVERTIDDAKNSVLGYVEARDRADVHATVKAAMGARAARSVDEADANHTVDHRNLIYAGAAVVALFLTLVVLFLVFRPTQFQSLLGRAFAPFSSDPIATRTQITLVEPHGGDVTVTAGQSITVKVEVGGRIPKPDRADKVRLLIRYNPAAAEYDELPLEPGETSRDWYVQIRPEQLRTGAWYKVAGGDAETAEHRVTVRTAPLFTDFEVSYDFPAYTRRAAEKATDPHLQAIRNTKVSVVAKANRPVRDGRAAFDPPGQPGLTGKAVPGRPDALRFDFLLTTPGSYRLTFNAADGERSPDSLPFGIKVDEDFPPTVEIVRPELEDTQLPANGLLSVDGAAGDDYGLDKLTLKLKLVAPAERPLADRPYLAGKSFRREADGTFPKSLEYKDSVELPKLTDPAGGKVELKADMVIEYWLEATDNRTKPGSAGPEPDPNIGKSKVKRVRLTPPVEAPEQKQQQADRRDQRKQEEQKHAQDQQQKLNNEDRGPPPPADPNAPPKKDNPDPKGGDPKMPPDGPNPPMPPDMGMPKDGMGMPKDGMGMPKDGMGNMPPQKNPDPKMPPDKGNPGKGGDPMMPPEGKNNPDTMPMPMPMPPDPKAGKQDGMTKQDGKGMQTGMPMTDGMGTKSEMPETAPMPSDPARKEIENQANKVQDQLNQEKNGGGGAKTPPTAKDDERTTPAEQKSNPPMDKMPPDSQPKGNEGGMGASEPRQEGKVQPPEAPSTTKTEPKSGDPMPGSKGAQPSEKRNDPLGSDPGSEREPPKGGDPMMGKGGPPPKDDPMSKGGMPPPKGDPAAGGEPKPATQQKGGEQPMGDPMMGTGQPEPNPADNAGRAKTAPPTNDRGEERPQPNPMGGMQPQPNPNPRPQEGGEPKPDRPQEPGAVRPMPKAGDPMPMDGKGTEPKMGDPMGAAESRPGPNPMPKAGDPKMGDPKGTDNKGGNPMAGMPQPKGVEPGTERTNPGDMPPNGGTPEAPMPKSVDPMGAGGKQGDPKMGDPKAGQMPPMPMAKGMDDPTMGTKGGPMPKLDAQQKAELEQAAKELTNPDPAKQRDAREKLDHALGKEAGMKLEDIAKGLNSDDPAEKARAQQQLDDLRRQAEQMAGKEPEPKGGPPMPMPKGMGDPKAGPMDNMNPKGGPDPKGDMDTNPKGGPMPKFDPKELDNDLKNLNSKDDAKRQEARDKLDKTVGEKARRQAEQLQDDLNSNDPERQARAKEQLDELRRQAEQMAKDNPPGKGDGKDDRFREGGGVTPNNAKAMDADPRNRAKSAELTLDQFEKNRFNRDLQDRLGWTQEEYDRFLTDYRREVERLRRDAVETERTPLPTAVPPRPDNINAGSKIEGNPNAGPGGAQVGGPAYAAPGYGDALRRFQQGATQRPPVKKP